MLKNENISAIILAAGYSSRMGDFKPLLQLGAHKAIEHAIRCFQQAGIGDVRVVVGFRAAEVVEVAKPLGVSAVFNPDFAQGMYTSIQAGVKTLAPGVQAFFLLPVDIPLITPTTVEKMLDCCRLYQHGVVYPVFNGKRGHPPLITTRYKDEIVYGRNRDGLRGILTRHENEAFDLEVEDETVLLDMDTPQDYHHLLSYLKKSSIPTLDECWQMLNEAGVDERIKEHCCAVAYTALGLAGNLNNAGAGLDEDLILAGALLHDIARREPNHALVGARMLEARGYPLVAEVVGVHMDIEVSDAHPLTEAEVVYYVDKMVKGNVLVSINDRFGAALRKYKDDRRACAAVLKRLRQAERIERKIEEIMDYPYEDMLELGCYLDEEANRLHGNLEYSDGDAEKTVGRSIA
ncbi:MAG TPA: hypothetical protein DCZ10_16440 [Pelotomaculum sp.]|nr:hypothetical protein [Pelotomaculum sp.]